MLLLHRPVLLYKSFTGDGFNILSDEFKMLEEGLSYVHMRDVSFVIYPERKEVMNLADKRTVHALASGVLVSALPTNYRPNATVIKLLQSLPEVDYNPYTSDSFFIKPSLEKITHAKELYAYNGQVKIIV